MLFGCDNSPLGMSCGGSEVELCGPYEYAELSEPSMEPPGLVIGDFSLTASIRVVLSTCERAPAGHSVELAAFVPSTGPTDGGGIGGSLTSLLVLQDGMDGDTPGDSMIDVTVFNPFVSTLPENADITLRFSARSMTPGGCRSGVVEVPYRTGPRRP